MKIYFFALTCSLGFSSLGLAGTTTSSPIKDEMEKTQQSFVQTFKDNRKQIEQLKRDKEAAIANAKELAKIDEEGIEAINKYDLLLVVRYSDEKGKFKKAAPLLESDQKNLNALFQRYLHSTLLSGKTSAEFARKAAAVAVDRLEAIAKAHRDPTDSNNAELQIISQKMEDAEEKMKLVTELASRLGVNINAELSAHETVNSLRAPASTNDE